MSFIDYLNSQIFKKVFSNKGWPEWTGGILLGTLNVFFLAWALKPFTIFSGYLNWGRHIYEAIGLASFTSPPGSNPLLNKTSVGDIGLLLGAFTAAILSNEFRIRKPLIKSEYLEGFLGGFLMALGTVLSVGCNWGGFFSAITVLSLHGFLMFIGLVVGGWLGLLYVKRKVEKLMESLELSPTPTLTASTPATRKGYTILTGAIVSFVISALLLFFYAVSGEALYAGILLMGFFVGVILQRSRFCFATAFRDLVKGPELRRSLSLQKGIVLALFIGVTGSFILKYLGYIDPMTYVKPSGLSNIIGGVFFGLGMVIAGGCASGSLWRAAEGHTKLWVTLLAMVVTYPLLRALVHNYAPWVYGPKIFIPQVFGWALGLVVVYALLALYLLCIIYLEYKFSKVS